jgi:DNA-binding NarL/FixJ family response regulator
MKHSLILRKGEYVLTIHSLVPLDVEVNGGTITVKESYLHFSGSEQQQKVIKMLRELKTNKEIANAMNLSESTVKYHVKELMKQANVRSRAELARTHQEERTSIH